MQRKPAYVKPQKNTALQVGSRLMTWEELPEWRRDNKDITSGYRLSQPDYIEVLAGLTFLHNETCNVYTHLVGASLMPFITAAVFNVLAESHFRDVTKVDYLMFSIFFLSAELCLVFSAVYHLIGTHSPAIEQFWHQADLLGIILATTGTFIPRIYYIFICDSSLQKLHWTIVAASGSLTAGLICIPCFRTLRWRNIRISAYIAFGASALIPMLHGVYLFGINYMLQYSGMRWYLLELMLYSTGVCLYGFRIPERFSPGTFDLWGSSHQIFHVFILCAMFVHNIALQEAFTASHTSDICQVQAAFPAVEKSKK